MRSRYQIISKRAEETSSTVKSTTTQSSTSTSVITSSITSRTTISTTVKAVVTTTTSSSSTSSSKIVSSSTSSTTVMPTILQKEVEPSFSMPPPSNPTLLPSQNTNNPPDTVLDKGKGNNRSLYISVGVASAVGVLVIILFLCCILKCRKNKNNRKQGLTRSIPVSEITKSDTVQTDHENQEDKSNIPYYQNDYGNHTSFNYSNYNNANNGSVYSGSGTNPNPYIPSTPKVNTNLYSNGMPNNTPSYLQSGNPTNAATVATNSSITCCTNYVSSMTDYNINSNGNESYSQWISPINPNGFMINLKIPSSVVATTSPLQTTPLVMNRDSLINEIEASIDPAEHDEQEYLTGDNHSTTQGQTSMIVSAPRSESYYRSPQHTSFIRNDESCVGQVHSPRNESFNLGNSSRVISPRIESLCLKNSLIEELRSEYSTYERPPLANTSTVSLTTPKRDESFYANQSHISLSHSRYDETMLTNHSLNSIKDSFFSAQDNSTVVRTATIVPEYVESSVVAEALVPEIIESASTNPSESPRPSLGESSTNGLICTSLSMGERRLSQPPHTGYRSPEAHYLKRVSIQSGHSNKAVVPPSLPPEKIKPYVPNIIEDSDEHEEIDDQPTPILEKKKPYVPNIIEDEDHVNNMSTTDKKRVYVPNIIEDDEHHILDELNFD